MLEPIYQLINLLEEGNDKKLTKFLKRHTIEDLLKEKDVDSDDEYCLALQAIKYKSSIYLKYLLESNYPVNEIDYFGRSTYNYLELYGTEEINELLKDYQVTPDNHLEEAYKALEQAKKTLSYQLVLKICRKLINTLMIMVISCLPNKNVSVSTVVKDLVQVI